MALNARRIAGYTVAAVVVFLVVAQFIPVDRTNPPSDPGLGFDKTMNPPPDVKATLDRSCRDCHSHDTRWPWYSRVAPASWLVLSDVKEGRQHVNLSEWGKLELRRASRKLDSMCEEMTSGDMPPFQYTLIHRGAKVTPQEAQAFCTWAKQVAGK